jgi:hypothetical protein
LRKTASILISGTAIALIAYALIAYFRKKPQTSVTASVGGVPVPPSASNPPSGTIVGPALLEQTSVAPCPNGTHMDYDRASGKLVCVVN